jgi:hypothetical protein
LEGKTGNIHFRLPHSYAVDSGWTKYAADILPIIRFALTAYPGIQCGFVQPYGSSLNVIIGKHSSSWNKAIKHDSSKVRVDEGHAYTLKVELVFKASTNLHFVEAIGKNAWEEAEELYEY